MALSSVRQFTRQCSTDFSSGKITFSGAQGSDKHRFTLTMAWHGSVSWFSRALLILTLVSFAINVVAFVSPFWMLVDDALGRSYSGLWTVCIFEVCGDFIHHSMFSTYRNTSFAVSAVFISHACEHALRCRQSENVLGENEKPSHMQTKDAKTKDVRPQL